jgi:hypothetical protein
MINSGELQRPPEITDLKILIQGFLKKHEPIKDLFAKTGLKLQRLDSDISEDIMTHFCSLDIPILGVHDSYIVATIYEEKLRKAMKEVFYNKFNVICYVSKKGSKKT